MAVVTINEERCKGCGLCVRACPKKIMQLSKSKLNAKGYHPRGGNRYGGVHRVRCLCAYMPGRRNSNREVRR